MDFLVLNPRPHRVLLPAAYKDQLETLYSHLPAERDMGPADPDFDPEGKTHLNSQIFSFAQVVRTAVHRVGTGFQELVGRKEKEAQDQGVEVFQVWLKLTDPGVGWAVDFLRIHGYFFGGLLPRWFDDDGLLVQKTLTHPRWEDMHIGFHQGRMLADMVRQDREEVMRT